MTIICNMYNVQKSKKVDVPVPTNPIVELIQASAQFYMDSFQVEWDPNRFGIDNHKFPLYISHSDASEISVGNRELSISVMQFWIL